MAPPRRPGLTVILQRSPDGDPAKVLLWTAVPTEHCSAEMLKFRGRAAPMRTEDDAMWGGSGLPCSDHARHPTMMYWQAGGVVLFGYKLLWALRRAQVRLAAIYIGRSGQVLVRDPS